LVQVLYLIQVAGSVFLDTFNKMPSFTGTRVFYLTQKITPLIHITQWR